MGEMTLGLAAGPRDAVYYQPLPVLEGPECPAHRRLARYPDAGARAREGPGGPRRVRDLRHVAGIVLGAGLEAAWSPGLAPPPP